MYFFIADVLENGQPIGQPGPRHHFRNDFFENVSLAVGDVDEIAVQAVVANTGTVKVFANLGLVL